jgi:hypothetical protein
MEADEIKIYPLFHGGIQRVRHERLDTEIDGQTALATLRFYRQVRVDRIEIPPVVYGRAGPAVPTHLKHVTLSVFDRETGGWKTMKEAEFPENSKFSGAGLTAETPMEEMERHFQQALEEQPPHILSLDGLETDHVRLECDREHLTWPNHGECNGNEYHVPYGALHEIRVYGEPLRDRPAVAPYHPILQRGKVAPSAPEGMKLELDGRMILYRGRKLAVGFSPYRPILLHLAWDALGEGKVDLNRLLVTRSFANKSVRIVPLGGLSGPVLRTLDFDIGSHLWTGRFEVEGNEVRYLGLKAAEELEINAIFRVHAEGFELDIEEICHTDFHAVEYEAWRFAWDVRNSPTGVSAVPTLAPGRNGQVALPAWFAGEGSGCLSLEQSSVHRFENAHTHLQVESYRESEALTTGIVPGPRCDDGFGVVVPKGRRRSSYKLAVTNLQPLRDGGAEGPVSPGIGRHWATMFSCYRPEYRGFSNNCISVNCHLGLWSPLEVLAHTEQPDNGPDVTGMLKFSVEKAVLDGGGYGYWREYYMDADPGILCSAGTAYRIDLDPDWLERIRPGLVEIFERMAGTADEDGLLINENLSGNSGEFTRSTNGIDTVCFGHLDAYSNAWSYRAFRNVAPLFSELGDTDRARRAVDLADRLRAAYGPTFINPETGWVAGWRSRDGKLHDFAYVCINGMATAFGLLDDEDAHRALDGLEDLRAQVCPVSPQLGLPVNLIPHTYEDHYWPQYVRGSQPTYEMFTDGAVSSNLIEYYLRALSIYGFKEKARELADEFDRGYAGRIFSGGVGSGNEMRSWDGVPTGYEGTLTYNHGLIYAVAVEKGYVTPRDPEWWPAMPVGE